MTFENINAVKKDISRRMEGATDILHQEFINSEFKLHFNFNFSDGLIKVVDL